jgi:hypothetical protein
MTIHKTVATKSMLVFIIAEHSRAITHYDDVTHDRNIC